MFRQKKLFLSLILSLVLVACSTQEDTASTYVTPEAAITPVVPLSEEWIVYCGFPGDGEPKSSDVFLTNADGSVSYALQPANDPSAPYEEGCHGTYDFDSAERGMIGEYGLSWSSDGTLILLSDHGSIRYAEVDQDGSPGLIDILLPRKELLSFFDDPSFPVLSPDGEMVAVSAWSRYGNVMGSMNIWVVEIDGSNPMELTEVRGLPQIATRPKWSPDGKWIAFSFSAPYSGAGVVSRDGSQRKFFNDQTDPAIFNAAKYILEGDPTLLNESVSWFPDSSAIIFPATNEAEMINAIYRYDLATEEITNLVPGNAYFPALSPDGNWLVYVSFFDERTGDEAAIIRSEVDGSNPVELLRVSSDTNWGTLIRDLSWSPDGTRIAFASNHKTDTDIYIMNADGRELFNLTNRRGFEVRPQWRPHTQP